MKTQNYPVIGGVNPVIEHDQKAFKFGARREGAAVEPDMVPAECMNRKPQKSVMAKVKDRWCSGSEPSSEKEGLLLDKPKTFQLRDLSDKNR